MTAYEFVTDLYNEADTDQLTAMTIETAAADLGNYARDGWDIPDDLTPELYAEIWNELLDEQFPA